MSHPIMNREVKEFRATSECLGTAWYDKKADEVLVFVGDCPFDSEKSSFMCLSSGSYSRMFKKHMGFAAAYPVLFYWGTKWAEDNLVRSPDHDMMGMVQRTKVYGENGSHSNLDNHKC